MLEFKPILGLATGFLVSFLVAHGVVDAGNADKFNAGLDGVFGLLIALVTAIYGLHKFVHKPGESSTPDTTPAQVSQTTVVAPAVDPAPVAAPTATPQVS